MNVRMSFEKREEKGALFFFNSVNQCYEARHNEWWPKNTYLYMEIQFNILALFLTALFKPKMCFFSSNMLFAIWKKCIFTATLICNF